MKAIVVVSPGKIEVRDVPMPEPGPDEALVEIEACGLCGTTDRHIVEGRQAHHPAAWYPAVLGHEAVGKVVQIGRDVRKFQVGDRVTRPAAIWPGCTSGGLYSAWGGFAEYGIVRDRPGELDYTGARQHVAAPALTRDQAVLAISISEVASWMEKIGNLDGQNVVIGGTGFAASVMCQCARAQKARTIIAVGRNPGKFEWALRNGATHAVGFGESTKREILDFTGGTGADWFFDAAGHQAVFEAGLGWLRPGGQAAIYGAPEGFAYRLPLGAVGGDFTVHYLSPTDDTFYQEACRRILAGQIDVSSIHTHTWRGLNSLPLAIDKQATGSVLKGMVLIEGNRGK
jgi:threonine dehydrogenase-like Zn-dependent dehydrogenase